MNWKTFFQSKKSINEFIITVVVLIALMLSFSQFILFIEQREGVVLSDPVLNVLHPIDLTWLTFALIYISLILFLISNIKDPQRVMIALQTYGLMVIFRSIAMYLTPFEAPGSLLVLNDPFVQLFGKGNVLTKDLFFSGHTATLFLLFLLSENKTLKSFFLFSTILVGSAVLLQHVHYAIDVFVAPFVAFGSYRIIKNLHIKFSKGSQQ
jgi:hypothetical protein